MGVCQFCGRQVPDGQICSCQQGAAGQQGMPNQGYQNQGMPNQGYPNQGYPNQGYPNQGYPNQGYQNQGYQNQGYQNQGYPNGQGYPYGYPPQPGKVDAYMSQAKNILSETLDILKVILKAPSDEGARFVASGNSRVSWALLLLQAVATGLLSLILALKVNSLASDLTYGYVSVSIVSVPKAFFFSIIMSVLFGLIFAMFTWIVAAISKATTNFSQVLGVAGVRAALLLPVTLVCDVLSLVSPVLAVGIFMSVGGYLSYSSQMESMRGLPNINNNKKTYAAVVAMMIFVVITSLLTVWMAAKCENVSKSLSSLGSYFDIGDLLEDIF